MKTENMNQVESLNQNVNPSEEKKAKYEMARDAAAGTMGGVIGGAAGAAVGSVIAQEANAQEPIVDPEPSPNPEPAPAPARPQPQPEPQPVKPEPQPVKPEPQPEPQPEPEPEPEVQVVGYEAVQTEDGDTMQIAAVSVEGEVIQFAEVTGDDIVDLAAIDANHDGTITEDEIIDVSDEGISMQALHDAYQDTQNIAQNTNISEPDYINDGNVDDFIA